MLRANSQSTYMEMHGNAGRPKELKCQQRMTNHAGHMTLSSLITVVSSVTHSTDKHYSRQKQCANLQRVQTQRGEFSLLTGKTERNRNMTTERRSFFISVTIRGGFLELSEKHNNFMHQISPKCECNSAKENNRVVSLESFFLSRVCP